MTLAEITQVSKKHGLYPILVAGDALRSEDRSDLPLRFPSSSARGHLFIGSIDEYFAAVKFLGSTILLIQVTRMTDSHFKDSNVSYLPSGPVIRPFGFGQIYDDIEVDHTKTTDLIRANPSLGAYRQYVGAEHSFRLSARAGSLDLDYFFEEDWWPRFLLERDKACQEWETRAEKMEEVERKVGRKKEEESLKVIDSLISDPDFVTLSTQASMREYALEKFPYLEEDVDPRLLTQKIRRVKDQIKSRQLQRKRR